MKYFSIKKDILATLTYFDLFNYPLRKNEIFTFLSHYDNYYEFERALGTMTNDLDICKMGEFYSLHDDHAIAARRSRGNEKAALMLRKAEQAANIISAFPFVKGVAVSGSLSKYFADENTDIDFFIITTANRLWISRTLLHCFKKLTYLFKIQDLFCMNYFIDEAEPVILEKNIYTAMEVATILPLRGNGVFDLFFKENNWTKNFFPNKSMYLPPVKETRNSWFKIGIEKSLNNRLGDFLDNFLMRLTAKSWNSKTRSNKTNSKGILLSMHVDKHFSKPNPELFQRRLLQRYEYKLSEIFKQYELSRYC